MSELIDGIAQAEGDPVNTAVAIGLQGFDTFRRASPGQLLVELAL